MLLADDVGFLMHGLLLVALFGLMTAMVLALPLIWADFKRDLDARLRADAEPAPPAVFDQKRDAEWERLLNEGSSDIRNMRA